MDGIATLAHRPAGSRYWRAPALGGLECLHARFTTHRYARHSHDGYAIGVVVDGAEQYAFNGRRWHVAPLRTIIAINPGEVHDGASAARNGWTYRMAYPSAEGLEALGEELTGRGVRPTMRVRFETPLDGADPRVRRVRDVIDARPEAELTLEELSSEAGIGRYHLVRSFARAYGMTPHAWQIQCRLVPARRLIDRGRPLADAAAEAGFCDQSHLTNRFRSAYGITPGEYRRTRGGRPC